MKLEPTFLLAAMLGCISCFGQNTEGDYTIFADPTNYGTPYELDENRINLVFLAEGYTGGLVGSTSNDYPYFEAHKEAIVQNMFDNNPDTGNPFTVPFNRYRDYFNIYWVWVQSSESGAGCRTTSTSSCTVHESGLTCYTQVNNHFGCVYDYETNVHRLLFPQNSAFVLEEVQDVMFGGNTTAPLEIIILVNTLTTNTNPNATPPLSEWGGGGDWDVANGVGILATSRYSYSLNPLSPSLKLSANLCLHEFGHMLGELLDEYWYDMTLVGESNEAPNRTEDPSNPSLRWEEWQDGEYPPPPDATIDRYDFTTSVVEGPDDVYRPSHNIECKLEAVASNYCAVCKEALIEHIHDVVDPYDEDDISPDQGTTHPASSSLVFDPAVIDTDPSYMQVKWYVEGELVETIFEPDADGGTTDFTWQFDCSNSNLVIGDNTITAEVFDVTGYDDSSNPLGPVYTADTRLVREAGHSTDHKYEIEWTVNFNGESPNLLIRDFYNQTDNNQPISDVGDEPWQPFPLEGWFFDYTSDIKVSEGTQGATTSSAFDAIIHASPLGSDITAYVNVRIENIGCSDFSEDEKLHLYSSTNGGGLSWPGLWEGAYTGIGDVGYEVTHDGMDPDPATIPDINAGETGIVEIPWYIEDMTPGTLDDWNPCLLARIEGVTNDLIDAASPASDHLTNWIRFNNNIAMRNLTVDEPDGEGQHLEVIGGRPYSGGYT